MQLHHAKRIVLITTAWVSATLTLLLFGGLVLAGRGEAATAAGCTPQTSGKHLPVL